MPGSSRSASRPSSASAPTRCSPAIILAGLDPLAAILLGGRRRRRCSPCRRRSSSSACAAPISPSAPGSSPRSSGSSSRRRRRSAAAPARRCRRGHQRAWSASTAIERAVRRARPPAARDIVAYWLALALAVGTLAAGLPPAALAPRAGARRHPRLRAAAESVGVDGFRDQARRLCLTAASAPAWPAR